LEEGIGRVLDKVYAAVREKTAWFKIVLIIGTIVISVFALVKKKWLSALFMLLNLAVLCVVILMAPWGRANYYYSVFINMLVTIVLFGADWYKNHVLR
jgi:hypothetical protein